MRPRSGALLTVAAGLVCLALATSVHHQQTAAAAVAPPRPATPGQSGALPIDWTAAGRLAQGGVNERGRAVNAKFIAANRAKIDQITIPVLLPGDPGLAPELKIFPNGAFYTASSSASGMSVVITGAGRAFALAPGTARGLPQGELATRVPADGVVIEQTEAGVDASFSRFGASYSVALECAQSHNDPRCRDDAYVRGLVARMMVVMPTTGGTPGAPETAPPHPASPPTFLRHRRDGIKGGAHSPATFPLEGGRGKG